MKKIMIIEDDTIISKELYELLVNEIGRASCRERV